MIVSSTIDKGNESMTILRERQYSSLKKAQSFLNTSLYSIKRGMDLDCVSIDLKEAWFSLGEITGKSLTEDIIDRIFEKFCLGK
jgi:tRNA modification GTPase